MAGLVILKDHDFDGRRFKQTELAAILGLKTDHEIRWLLKEIEKKRNDVLCSADLD